MINFKLKEFSNWMSSNFKCFEFQIIQINIVARPIIGISFSAHHDKQQVSRFNTAVLLDESDDKSQRKLPNKCFLLYNGNKFK